MYKILRKITNGENIKIGGEYIFSYLKANSKKSIIEIQDDVENVLEVNGLEIMVILRTLKKARLISFDPVPVTENDCKGNRYYAISKKFSREKFNNALFGLYGEKLKNE